LLDRLPIEIAEINGGSAQNAIPREAAAVVLLDPSRESELKSLVATAEAGYKADLGGFDSGLQITVEKAERREKCWMRMTRNKRWRCSRACIMAFWQ
jgi:dipeptidase D